LLDRGEEERYKEALTSELTRYTITDARWRGEIATVYFGGGTPSLMNTDFISKLLYSLRTDPGIAPDAEITLEANPRSVDVPALKRLRAAGINRLSIGGQSFVPEELALLGRRHDPATIGGAVADAREAGFDNISLDLIYGLPGSTLDSFGHSLRSAFDLGIDHLSSYALSIEPGTPFARMTRSGKLPPLDPDLAADQYQLMTEIARDHGFIHYELTNFSRPGNWSRHNYSYWRRIPYLGVGPSAHSFDGSKRFWNCRGTDDYIARIRSGVSAIDGEELLTDEEIVREQVYLALRTMDGLPLDHAERHCSPDSLNELSASGFLELRNNRWHIPEAHWLLLDEIVLRLSTVGSVAAGLRTR